jgi:LAO/AO transport system kinase
MQAAGDIKKARRLTVDDYEAGIAAGNRTVLARAITLIESQARAHEIQAQEILRRVLPRTGGARRIGVSGAPGSGKSTFIEALGCYLIDKGRKVAVLAIDPSSTISGGSILGDKTRMDRLCQQANAFIRPSPAGGSLGGVARRTRETMLLCEAAGFDTIIIESVGVGQAEVALRSMVDYFLLLLLPGAGDELQGIKKGIMEIADGVLINKADGENRLAAERARLEQEGALGCLRPATPGWQTTAGLCSARTGEGVPAAWERIEAFYKELEPKGAIAARRRRQMLDWLADLVREGLLRDFYQNPRVEKELPLMREAVLRGEMTAVQAAAALLAARRGDFKRQANDDDAPSRERERPFR